MSTPFNDPNDQRPAFERLMDDRNFDGQGNFIKEAPAEGDPGTDAPPAPAQSTAENTAATPPPPDNPEKPAPAATATEDKSSAAPAGDKSADEGQPAATAPAQPGASEEETEEALKQRFSKPDDKGDEWQIRAYREAQKITKRLAPVQVQLDRVGTERAQRGLDFVSLFGEPDEPIANAADKLEALAQSRAVELRNFYYYETLDHFPENVLRDLLEDDAATVGEVKEALALKRSGAKPAEAQPQPAVATTVDVPKPEGMTDEDWNDFKIDYPAAYKAMQATQASTAKPAEPPAAPKDEENAVVKQLQTELQELRGQVTQRTTDEYVQRVQSEGVAVEAKVFSVVEDRLRELGLEANPAKDDDATVTLKTNTATAIRKQIVEAFEGPNGPGGWDDWSLCSDEQKENRKIESKVMTLLAKGDFKAANDYVEHLQARVDLVLDRIVEPNLKNYNAAMVRPTDKPRNAGQEHQRPEIIGGAASAATNGGENAKTPWLADGYKQPGEDSFAAMSRWLTEHPNQPLPGRL